MNPVILYFILAHTISANSELGHVDGSLNENPRLNDPGPIFPPGAVSLFHRVTTSFTYVLAVISS